MEPSQELTEIMKQYGLKPSIWYEIKFHIIGKFISASCYVIGWVYADYFAGRLESGNVCDTSDEAILQLPWHY